MHKSIIKNIYTTLGNKMRQLSCHNYSKNKTVVDTIVISQNGTSPSQCWHSSCWYTKGQFGLKWPKHYRWAWPLIHFSQTRLVYFYYGFWVAYTTMCITSRVYLHMQVPFEQLAYHTRVAYINTHVYLNLTLKNINQD